MPYNVPDDWNSYYSTCSDCGERIHASENHDCEPEEEEETAYWYVINTWIKVDDDDPATMTYDEAEAEVKHLQLMHPDNKYEIEEYEND